MNDECNNKTCPWQGGKGLSGKIRRLIHNPDIIFSDYIKSDMWVLDAGCGMGYMAVAAATAVGSNGKVVMVDIQREMLDGAVERMRKAGLEQRTVAVQCRQKSLCIDEYTSKIDFAYAFMMVHEVDDKKKLLLDLLHSLKPNGRLLIAEPYIHVSRSNYQETLNIAKEIGFEAKAPKKRINLCYSVILEKL